jgi:hypothetical protein
VIENIKPRSVGGRGGIDEANGEQYRTRNFVI